MINKGGKVINNRTRYMIMVEGPQGGLLTCFGIFRDFSEAQRECELFNEENDEIEAFASVKSIFPTRPVPRMIRLLRKRNFRSLPSRWLSDFRQKAQQDRPKPKGE